MQRKVRCTDDPANELMDSILQKRKNEKNLKNSQVQNYLLRLVLGFRVYFITNVSAICLF